MASVGKFMDQLRDIRNMRKAMKAVHEFNENNMPNTEGYLYKTPAADFGTYKKGDSIILPKGTTQIPIITDPPQDPPFGESQDPEFKNPWTNDCDKE